MRIAPRKYVMATAILVASAAAVAASVTPASADPLSTTTVHATDIVSVGSDTIQALDNGISSDRTGGYPGLADGTGKYYSYDATGTSPIAPKPNCDTTANPPGAGKINRPNGSSAGINTLNATDDTCVDIARSSRGSNGTGTSDDFIPFAKDAVGWSAFTGGHAPANLTSAELTGIYNCTYTKWNALPTDPTTSGDTIHVFVPQTGSGTRSFFLAALGITATTEPCWQTTTPEENEGTDPVFVGDTDAIFPYSLSHYVGQVYDGKGSTTDAPGALDALRSLDSTPQIDTTNKVWTSTLPSKYIREVYHVVRATDWTNTTEGPRLSGLLGRYNSTTHAGGWLCSPTGQAVVTSYGFESLGAGCGTPQPGM